MNRGLEGSCMSVWVKMSENLDKREFLLKRAELKDRHAYYLNKLVESRRYQRVLQLKGLEYVRLVPYDERYFVEAMSLLCYQFSVMGGQMHNTLLCTTVDEAVTRFRTMLEHAALTGLSLAITDTRTNRLIGVMTQYDIRDAPPFFSQTKTEIRNRWSIDQQRRRYLNQFSALKLQALQNIYDGFDQTGELIIKPDVPMGQVMYRDCAAIIMSEANKGILGLGMVDTLPWMGYSLSYGLATNPITVGKMARSSLINSYKEVQTVDVSSVVYLDGLCLDDIRGLRKKDTAWKHEYIDGIDCKLLAMADVYCDDWVAHALHGPDRETYLALMEGDVADAEIQRLDGIKTTTHSAKL